MHYVGIKINTVTFKPTELKEAKCNFLGHFDLGKYLFSNHLVCRIICTKVERYQIFNENWFTHDVLYQLVKNVMGLLHLKVRYSTGM